MVLHADDGAEATRILDLPRGHVAQPDVLDQALPLQFGQGGERLLQRALGRPVDVQHAAQVDQLQRLQTEVAQVVVYRPRQLVGGQGGQPRPIGPPLGAHLGGDEQILAIGVQRLANDLVGDVRAIEVSGVDVIDTALHGRPQHRHGGCPVLGRAEDAGSGELHRAVPEALHVAVADAEGAGLVE